MPSDVMNEKVVIELPKPMPASDDCLPHAAMTLGSARGSGTRPREALVHRLIIEQQSGDHWMLYRLDGSGGFVGDTSHPTKEDALRTARREFGVEL